FEKAELDVLRIEKVE
ncbi:hypothetical protein BVZ80_01206B, partial [Haemophilus influenzae]